MDEPAQISPETLRARWQNGEELETTHEALFAGREPSPADYALVRAALGVCLGQDALHRVLRGGDAPADGWSEPWFPGPQRRASTLLRESGPDALLRDVDLERLRTHGVKFAGQIRKMRMPFGSRLKLLAIHEMSGEIQRRVGYGMSKYSTPPWLDPSLMLPRAAPPPKRSGKSTDRPSEHGQLWSDEATDSQS